jgi:hypothetical protein
MLHSEIDHLVIAAPSLEDGAGVVQRALGVTPQVGGEHHLMGTHNRLLKLGKTTYLEVIAPDPAAPKPKRPRWYELDSLEMNAPPCLVTWVARVNDIEAAQAASPVSLGRIEPMSRGQLSWLITIPEDGSLPLQGVVPTLIQWEDGYHPTSQLKDLGCSLVRLEGFHPEAEKIAAMLKAVGFDGVFTIVPCSGHEKPFLVATIQTPGGVRQLGGP